MDIKFMFGMYLFIFTDENTADKHQWLFPAKYYKRTNYKGFRDCYCISYDDYHDNFWSDQMFVIDKQ